MQSCLQVAQQAEQLQGCLGWSPSSFTARCNAQACHDSLEGQQQQYEVTRINLQRPWTPWHTARQHSAVVKDGVLNPAAAPGASPGLCCCMLPVPVQHVAVRQPAAEYVQRAADSHIHAPCTSVLHQLQIGLQTSSRSS